MSKLSMSVAKLAAKPVVRTDRELEVRVDLVVPETPEALDATMEPLGLFLDRGGWFTAAVVYAWAKPGQGRRTSINSDGSYTVDGFAALGYRGLASRNTVLAYRAAWEHAIARGWAKPVVPGERVVLPTQDWDLSAVRPAKPAIETPALPDGTFGVIVADPPWDVLTGPGWGSGGAARPLEYATMTTDAIAALSVRDRAAPDAHLYLWTINAYVEAAYTIARSWGFEPSTLLTWCKPPHGLGLGGTYVLTTEHVLFARRGSLASTGRLETNWFQWPRRGHSVKPDEFYAMVESVSPDVPRLEMFARQVRPGWTAWGGEAPNEP